MIEKDEVVKICDKHGFLAKEDMQIYRRKDSKSGYRARCKKCILEYRLKALGKDGCKIHGFLKPGDIKSDGRCKLCHRTTANTKRNTDPITKAARNARVAQLRAENPEKYRELDKKYKEKWMPKGYRIREVLQLRGIDAEQYEKLVKDHDGKCAICGMPETRRNPKNPSEICRLVIDHSHETNMVRGLLCHGCNVGIGHLKDNLQLILNAYHYIDYWDQKLA